MTLIPGIKQISQVGNDMYIQGAFPVGIGNTDVSYLADPADTRLLAGRDPVIEEVSVGMSGSETGIKTVSGAAPLHITDAMKGMLRFLETNIKPVQDLHGYANPWPAGGGKNLADPANLLHGYYQPSSPAQFVSDEKYCTFKQTLSAGTYTFKTYMDDTYMLRWAYDGTNVQLNADNNPFSFTLSDTAVVQICFRKTDTSTITEDFNIQLETGTLSTSFAPYENICPITGWTGCNVYVSPTTNQADATVYPCTWQDDASIVYGGTADVISGSGSDVMLSCTGDYIASTLNVTYFSSYQIFRINVSNAKSEGRVISNKYKTIPTQAADVTANDNCCFMGKYGFFDGNLCVKDTSFNGDVAAFKASLTASDQFVYERATPTYFTFPGSQIMTQEGTNYIWTDCGDTITAAYVGKA